MVNWNKQFCSAFLDARGLGSSTLTATGNPRVPTEEGGLQKVGFWWDGRGTREHFWRMELSSALVAAPASPPACQVLGHQWELGTVSEQWKDVFLAEL